MYSTGIGLVLLGFEELQKKALSNPDLQIKEEKAFKRQILENYNDNLPSSKKFQLINKRYNGNIDRDCIVSR